MKGLVVEVGDHQCSTPVLVGDVTKVLGETDGSSLTWVCDECGSTWDGTREFRKGWPGTERYDFGISWRRRWGSSRRWRKRERERIYRALTGKVEGPW